MNFAFFPSNFALFSPLIQVVRGSLFAQENACELVGSPPAFFSILSLPFGRSVKLLFSCAIIPSGTLECRLSLIFSPHT